MQRKDLALRVLSTAAIMSIVTSIAAPAFADIYYIGNGSIDVVTKEDANGKKYVEVKQGDNTYTDTSDEIVIKDGNNEGNAAQKEESRIEGKKAKVAIPNDERPATQELEAAGSADAAGESQPDPDAGFTLNETGEDSAQNQEGNNPTEDTKDNPTEDTKDNPTENPKKDVVYEYAPADPEPEKQATKPAPAASADPAAKTPETTLADASATAPTPATPAEGSAAKPTKNVIKVINNWAEKVLNIRLSNVNIESDKDSTHADGKTDTLGSFHGASAAEVQGSGNTKIELDGQNRLDNSQAQANAGLRKQGEGTLTITDETDDNGNKITAPKSGDSGSLTAKGATSNGSAGIGGKTGESTKNIIIEGYATVDATGGGQGAGIGGGGGTAGHVSGDAENIIIRGHSKVTATAGDGAAIGGGSANGSGNDYFGGSAKGIVICEHAKVVAKNNGYGAAIGAAGGSGNHTEAVVTIGTPGATAAKEEDVQIIATGSNGSAIGNGRVKTEVTIQGHATVQTASSKSPIAIGSYYGNVEVNIKDNASIDTATGGVNSGIGGGRINSNSGRTVKVTIDGGKNGNVRLGENSAIVGESGAISATEVNISNNVLLKMKQWASTNGQYIGQYISVNGTEAEVGKRSNPTAGGLVNTIGDNTELWYSAHGILQKIVHGKNVCRKNKVSGNAATCTTPGSETYECTYEHDNGAVDPEHKGQWVENTAVDPNAHDWGAWTVTTPATCTTKGVETRYCNRDHSHVETRTTPALGHHWVDNGDGTHTCPDCGATEGQPVNTNSALELRVVDAEGMDQPFTVSQNGTLRTYTGAYDIATLTGDLNTLRYLQEHGAQTIRFVTNGQTSSFAINDLLAQGSGSEVFYLTHRGAEEPTLLLVEADHSELVKD